MGFFRNFKQAYKGEEPGSTGEEPGSTIEVRGIQIRCSHCGSIRFSERKAQLNTAGMTFLNLDWANKSATVLVCESCGKLEWFI